MIHEEVQTTLTKILENTRQIEYKGIVLYLLSTSQMQEVLAVELTVRADNIENGIEKKKK